MHAPGTIGCQLSSMLVPSRHVHDGVCMHELSCTTCTARFSHNGRTGFISHDALTCDAVALGFKPKAAGALPIWSMECMCTVHDTESEFWFQALVSKRIIMHVSGLSSSAARNDCIMRHRHGLFMLTPPRQHLLGRSHDNYGGGFGAHGCTHQRGLRNTCSQDAQTFDL
jgi:hypothetical protein